MKTIALCVGTLALVSMGYTPPPEIPQTPAAVEDLLYARPFTLEKGFKFFWCKERPNVTTGTLLVLQVDKALVVPRAIPTPVLYVGDQPAERVNHGHKSGRVVAIVPGEADLAKVPIWFGTPALPGQVDAAAAQSERALAEEAGIRPFPAKKVEAALAKGGEPIKTTDKSALLRDELAELILEYCPDEKHLADGFRVPVVTRQKPKEPAEDEE